MKFTVPQADVVPGQFVLRQNFTLEDDVCVVDAWLNRARMQ